MWSRLPNHDMKHTTIAIKSAYKTWALELEVKNPTEGHRRGWEETLKEDAKDIVREVVYWN